MMTSRGLKKGLILALIIAMVAVLAACGGGNGGNSSKSSNSGNATGNSGNQGSGSNSGEKITLKFSHNVPEDTAIHKTALSFKEEVETNSNGQIEVEIYPNLQMGAMREQAEQAQFGSTQMTTQTISILTAFNEEISMLDLPFLFPTEEKMWEILDGPIGQDLLATFDGTGLKGLGFWAVGPKSMTNNNGPINGPEDLKGLKMRVIPSPLLLKQYESWGAAPTPIDLSELYTALQQGVVTGQENDLETTYTQKIYEVQKYLTKTNHSILLYVFVANEDWFNGLSPDLQEVVATAAKNSSKTHYNLRVEEEASRWDAMEKSGIQINELPEAGRQAFIEASKPVYDEFLKTPFQKETFQRISEAAK